MNVRNIYGPLMAVTLIGMLAVGCIPTWERTLPDLVILQLDREHAPIFSGFYAAYDRGFYSQKRLEVVIKNGGPGVGNPIELVVNGNAQFGVCTGAELVTAFANGKPVVAIGALSTGAEDENTVYDAVLFTSRPLIEENHDLVERFMIASMRGWNFVLTYPEMAPDMVLRVDPTLEYDNVLRDWNAVRHSVTPGVPYGIMDEDVWATIISSLEEDGHLSTQVNPAQVYTNEFLYCEDEEVDIYECR